MSYKELLKENLVNNICPFWDQMIDHYYGGFYGGYNLMEKELKEAPKGLVYISRILYSYSKLYHKFNENKLLENAEYAYKFLVEKMYDNDNRGFYWSCTFDGNPLNKSKHLYGQTFALYGLSAYYQVSQSKEALKYAKEIVEIIQENLNDFPRNYHEQYTQYFTPMKNELLKGYGMVPEITTNTLLHLAEGLGLYYEVTNDPDAKELVLQLFDIIFNYGYDAENKNLYQFLDYSLKSVIDVYSYGHNLEVSWLFHEIMEQCDIENDKWFQNCMDLFENSFEIAYQNGYIINETVNGITNYSAIWWVQAEALVALVNILKIKKNPKHKEAINSITEFILDNFALEGMDWLWEGYIDTQSDNNGIISDMWKANYHNVRAILKVLEADYE